MRKYSHFITVLTVLLVLILAAGCGGGGATSAVPSVPTDSPIVSPTATTPTSTPTSGPTTPTPDPNEVDPNSITPTVTPVDPNTIIPISEGELYLKTDWPNCNIDLVKLPADDFFNYVQIQGGTDQIWSQLLEAYNETTNSIGEIKVRLIPGRYAIYQNLSSAGKINASALTERYYIGQVTLKGGEQTIFSLQGENLVTLSIKIRFKYPTSYLDYQEYLRTIGYITDQTNSEIWTVLFDLRDNYEIKQWQFTGKFRRHSLKFTGIFKNINDKKYNINPDQTIDLSSAYVQSIEKKFIINNISPAGDSTKYNLDDSRLLLGADVVDNYVMITTNPAGALILCTYDKTAGTELKDQVAILGDYATNDSYVAYFPVKTDSLNWPDNKLMSLSVRQTAGDGQLAWCNVLGTYFSSYGSELVVPILFSGKQLIGLKADAYEKITGIGAGPITVNLVGNFNAEEIYKYPGE